MEFRGDRLSTHSDTDDDAHLLAIHNIKNRPRTQNPDGAKEREICFAPSITVVPMEIYCMIVLGADPFQRCTEYGGLTQSSSLLPPWLPVRFTNEATTSTRRDRCKAWVGMGWLDRVISSSCALNYYCLVGWLLLGQVQSISQALLLCWAGLWLENHGMKIPAGKC